MPHVRLLPGAFLATPDTCCPRKMHPGLDFGEALLSEMRQYLREQSETTGRERFHAASTGAHDDLISALVMCAWWGESFGNNRVVQVPLRW